MSVSMRRPLQVPPSPSSAPTRFSPPRLYVVLQEILYQLSFTVIRLLRKIMDFQSNTSFFFQLIAGRFLILQFRFYVFLTGFSQWNYHRETTNQSYIICMPSYLASHEIMWYNKRSHGLKITNCCLLLRFGWKLSSKLILPPQF